MFIKLSLEPLFQRRYLLSKFAKKEKSGRRARHASLFAFFFFIAAFNWTDCRP